MSDMFGLRWTGRAMTNESRPVREVILAAALRDLAATPERSKAKAALLAPVLLDLLSLFEETP